MIEQWQNLVGVDPPTDGYQQAINYYQKLKNRLIDQITDNAKKKLANIEYKNFILSVEEEILKNASQWGESYISAQTSLNNLENAVAQIIENNDISAARNILQEIHDKIYQKKNSVEKNKQDFKSALLKNQKQIFDSLGIDNNFIINLLSTNNTTGDINALANQAKSYFIRYLYGMLFDEIDFAKGSRFKYSMSMGGFYKELAEYEALEKIINQFINVYHGGDIKIGGKDTELDIVISILDDVESSLTQSTSITEQIMAIEEPPGTVDLENDLINQINVFGEQVKSRSLGSSDEFGIGNRAELYAAFKNEGANTYSSLQAIHFLARLKNILLSLGATNVLFSSNGKRYWMADFITEFRQKNYFLTFYRATNKSQLENKVVLEQYYTQKQKIKSRFLK